MGYLQEIGAWTHREVARRRETRPLAGALYEEGRVRVIAEIKRASPSEGPIAPSADAADVARHYEAGGAAAISVLTSPRDFAGSLLDLACVRAVTDLPLLCKDFFVDPYQVGEARAHGADAILVLLALVDDSLAADLIQAAEDHQMDVLCEVHDEAELARALALGCPLIGINARNLATLTVEPILQRTLLSSVPKGFIAVAESGVTNRADLDAAGKAGASAALVGTALMRNPDLLLELTRP
ncbi:MAG: indole-3-glycerol-phosphate synthase [Thermoleophilia bacterium]|nr:indole-3-glycerol-phosphate synthase [Thermoleophilia bacterium]